MGKGVRWFLKGLAFGYVAGATYGFVIAAEALEELTRELEEVIILRTIKLERITGYGRRGDWDGLREYVELNLLAGDRA